MTRTPFAVILGIFSLLAPSMSTTAQAQAPAAPEAAVKKSTSELTIAVLGHFEKVFSAAAAATDKATAEKAVASIATELQQVDALTTLLAASDKPTDAGMTAVAEATAKMEVKMSKLIETMARNLKNREVRAIIEPFMNEFAAKTSSLRVTMDKLYPAKKMLPLVKAAKARIQIKKAP